MPKLVVQPPQRFVTVTLDDLHVITDRDSDAVKLDTTNKLFASITKNKIPAIGFVNENQLRLIFLFWLILAIASLKSLSLIEFEMICKRCKYYLLRDF
ncbi:hypothetical protein [Nostoc sp.]|uniref:hypothetical protein n=1 Tax=Nostoc sp. TaxID=1180 RepID=UPI002FF4DE0B